jgi:hypothetical protein
MVYRDEESAKDAQFHSVAPTNISHPLQCCISTCSPSCMFQKRKEKGKSTAGICPKLVTKHISNQLGSKLTAFLEFCRNMQLQIDMRKASENVARNLCFVN